MNNNENQRQVTDARKGNGKLVEKNVIVLVRVSTPNQAAVDKAGVQAQRDACDKLVTFNTLKPRWPIDIIGVSGSDVMYCPEMVRIQEIVRSGECYGVVTREVSRMLRPENFEFQIFQILQENGCRVFTELGNYNLSNPLDVMQLTLLAGMSGLEKAQMYLRMNGGKEVKRKEGRFCLPKSSLGMGILLSKDRRLSYDHDVIGRVVLLYELFADGEMNLRELSRKTGIGPQKIIRILRNPLYIGWWVIEKMPDYTAPIRRNKKGRRLRRPLTERPAESVYRHKVIEHGAVPEDLWNQVQRMLDTKKAMHWKHAKGEDRFLFRGLLFCGKCGQPMTTKVHNNGRDGDPTREYYICRHGQGQGMYRKDGYSYRKATCGGRGLERGKLEALLHTVIKTQLNDESFLAKLIDAQEQTARRIDNRAKIASMKHDLERLVSSRARVKELYIQLVITRDEFNERFAVLGEQERTLHRELSKLKPVREQVSADYLSKVLQPFKQWGNLAPQEKRAILLQNLLAFNVKAIPREWHVSDYVVNGFWVGDDLTGKPAISTAENHQNGDRAQADSEAMGPETLESSGVGSGVFMNDRSSMPIKKSPTESDQILGTPVPFDPSTSIYIQLAG